MLQHYAIEERGDPDWQFDRLLVVLHGFSATERDLTPVAPLLDPDGHYLVSGLRGPVEVDGGAAWFDFGPRGPDGAGLARAVAEVKATVAALETEHGFAAADTVLVGFSQGAAMALATALAAGDDVPPAGVLTMCGFLAEADEVRYDFERLRSSPVLVQNGTADPIVDVEHGRGTAATLEANGVPVTFREYPMAHQTTVESLADARDWLARVRTGAVPR